MSVINACVDFYSNDFSNLTQYSYSTLSSIFSTLNSLDESQPIVEEDEENTVWKKLVEEHGYLPKSQPKVSMLKKQISKKLEFDFFQLFVEFFNIYSNKENNHQISEQSFDNLQDILWKCNTCLNKKEILDQDTGRAVKSKNLTNCMPKKPQCVNYIIAKINTIVSENKPRISQLKHTREQKRLEAKKLKEERLLYKKWKLLNPDKSLSFDDWKNIPVEEDEPPTPEWDDEPSTTQLTLNPSLNPEPVD